MDRNHKEEMTAWCILQSSCWVVSPDHVFCPLKETCAPQEPQVVSADDKMINEIMVWSFGYLPSFSTKIIYFRAQQALFFPDRKFLYVPLETRINFRSPDLSVVLLYSCLQNELPEICRSGFQFQYLIWVDQCYQNEKLICHHVSLTGSNQTWTPFHCTQKTYFPLS